MIRLLETGPVLGTCVCQAMVREDSLRDNYSKDEWLLSRMCQPCQDRIFLAPGGEGGVRAHPIRFGALVAHSRSGRTVLEVVLIPFLFIPELHRAAWEARYILRIGPMPSFAASTELNPMYRFLAGHRVRVTEVLSFDDPRLPVWFEDLDLLVALDQRSVDEIVGACPVLGRGLRTALADAVPWREIASRPLLPFESFVRSRGLDLARPDDRSPPSPLRVCARMAAALALVERGSYDKDRTALWHLLEGMRTHFSDSPKGA